MNQELLDHFEEIKPLAIVTKRTRLMEIVFEGIILLFWLIPISYLGIVSKGTGLFIIVCCKDLIGGKSLIKRIQFPNLKVVRFDTGKTPLLVQLMVRNVLGFFIFPLDILFILFNIDNRRLSDLITGTTVIIDTNPSSIKTELSAITSIHLLQLLAFCLFLFILLYTRSISLL